MSKKSPCGTYAAARRHERRNEPLDQKCAEALRAYRVETQRRRRVNLVATPPVIAVMPPEAGADVPAPWREWADCGSRTVPTVWLADYERSEQDVVLGEIWTRRIYVDRGIDPIRDAVKAWRANSPIAAELMAWLTDDERSAALGIVGYSALGHSWLHMGGSELGRHESQTITHPPMPDEPHGIDCPHPIRTGDWRHETEIARLHHTEALVPGTRLVVSTRRVVRAPAGTPVPGGWTEITAADEIHPYAWIAPLHLDDLAAVTAASEMQSSAARMVVLAARPGGKVEAWRGIGGMAMSLGVFGSVDLLASTLTDELARIHAGTPWVPRPPMRYVTADSPGWEAVERGQSHSALDEAWSATGARLHA